MSPAIFSSHDTTQAYLAQSVCSLRNLYPTQGVQILPVEGRGRISCPLKTARFSRKELNMGTLQIKLANACDT